jgi:hypothetical protein
MPSAPRYALDLNFWDIPVRVLLPTTQDVGHFSFQFRHYLNKYPTTPFLTLAFSSGGSGPWVQALTDRSEVKTIEYATPGAGFCLYETWRGGSRKPSPLPPLPFLPATERPTTVHAACAISPYSKGALMITGPSGNGKSSLLLYLLAEGWQYVADDLLPFRDGYVWTYLRTMNIGGPTLAALPQRLRDLIMSVGRQVSTPAGTTYLVHPCDLGYMIATTRFHRPIIRIRLKASREFTAKRQRDGSLLITWDPPLHRTEAVRAVGLAAALGDVS